MNFDAWIGRETRSRDTLTPALAARFFATFDLDPPASRLMPQGIHFCLCTPEAPTAMLGPDGHPARGGRGEDGPASFLPPLPMERRMWASSTIEFRVPLTIGAAVERISRIVSIRQKEGSSGPLAFVDVAHETRANGTLSVIETQTLVYREAAAPDAPLTPPEPGEARFDRSAWDAHRALTPDPRLLFRYSALTFNTHRIHYDAPYARGVERYRGLVVHGPLTASLLLRLAARELGENRLRMFAFRGLSPAIAGDLLHLAMREGEEGCELGAFAADGRQVMSASAKA
ncbi:MaoC family dehydratase N-terminal domain-containing protein [Erythrobacter sp. HL-111]|uniref:FAS1-like dehydratase domain-containing protein n=1 Tax=Erythrobacter sp. HL-111 TaxID=1798193 RepID=UPI0006DAFDC0|nr:MaoC family dehydratase N-terminal domain-containing protein [Erythrobacter sp. HL-111]KPP94848.1 MAG: mesaconyl-C4 CoA hydratase [Erythrobacteraceae bacterium HL-111]SDS87978.1 3-methylfumaryl-CoA hydratase [Erythrobacter sp. HL-111]